jgi:hypothetical protein
MTINEIKQDLFTYFAQNDSFDLQKDFNKIVLVSEEPEVDKQIVLLGLKEFEEQKLVSRLPIEGRDFFVLQQPLQQYSQTIELHYPTLEALAKVINQYCDEADNQKDRVNPLNVTETDIQNTIILAAGLKNEVEN